MGFKKIIQILWDFLILLLKVEIMQALKGLGTGNNQGIILKPNHYLLTGCIRIKIKKISMFIFNSIGTGAV